MRSRMVLGMGMLPEPATSLLVREVENGYVVDVEAKGDDPSRTVRFVKYIAQSHADLEDRVRVILEAFDAREPDASRRLTESLQVQQIDRKMMAIHQIKGGYLVVTAKPVKMKLDAALKEARGFRMECDTGSGPLPDEVTETVQDEEIRIDKADVMDALLTFFSKPAGRGCD